MPDPSPARRNGLFWLLLILWLAIAIPITLFSLLTFELPLWPSFPAENTREGIALWAFLAAWYYIVPVVLVLVGRRARRTKQEGR